MSKDSKPRFLIATPSLQLKLIYPLNHVLQYSEIKVRHTQFHLKSAAKNL